MGFSGGFICKGLGFEGVAWSVLSSIPHVVVGSIPTVKCVVRIAINHLCKIKNNVDTHYVMWKIIFVESVYTSLHKNDAKYDKNISGNRAEMTK